MQHLNPAAMQYRTVPFGQIPDLFRHDVVMGRIPLVRSKGHGLMDTSAIKKNLRGIHGYVSRYPLFRCRLRQ